MLFAADYPFLDIFWTMIIFFCWVAWIWMLIGIFGDIFRRSDASGWTKALSSCSSSSCRSSARSCT